MNRLPLLHISPLIRLPAAFSRKRAPPQDVQPSYSQLYRLLSSIRSFDEIFDENKLVVDEYGELTQHAVAHTSINGSPRINFKRLDQRQKLEPQAASRRRRETSLYKQTMNRQSRFSSEGLKQDESMYQLPFWEELKRKEMEQAVQLKRRREQKAIQSTMKWGPEKSKIRNKFDADGMTIGGSVYSTPAFSSMSLESALSSIDQVGISGNIGSASTSASEILLESSAYSTIREPTMNKVKSIASDSRNESTEFIKQAIPDKQNELVSTQSAEVVSRIIRCNNAMGVLDIMKGYPAAHIEPLIISSALSKLSHLLKTAAQRSYITQMNEFSSYMNVLHSRLDEFGGTDLGRTFVALVTLKQTPKWMPQLIDKCGEKLAEMDFRHFVGCLSTVLKMEFQTKANKEFQKCLMQHAEHRMALVGTADELAKLTTALGWASHVNDTLLELMKKKVEHFVDELRAVDLANSVRTFGKLNVSDPLLGQVLSNAISKVIQDCSINEIVKIAIGLTRMNAAHEEFFNLFISPSVRVFLPNMTTGEMAAIVSAYSTAGISDMDLIYDISRHMLPHIHKLTNIELPHIFFSFVEASFQDKSFYNFIKMRSLKLMESFNSGSLVKVIYSAAKCGITDEHFYRIACQQSTLFLPTMKPFYMMRLLFALDEAECLSNPIVIDIINRLQKDLYKQLFAEECLKLLTILKAVAGRFPAEKLFVQQLFNVICQRQTSWNVLKAEYIPEVLEAMHTFQYYDQQLLSLLYRRLHQNMGHIGWRVLMKLLVGLSDLPYGERQVVRSHLCRRTELYNRVLKQLNSYPTRVSSLDDNIKLLHALTKLGFETNFTNRLQDDILHKLESDKTTPYSLCLLLWSLVEMNSKLDWVRFALLDLLRGRYSSGGSPPSIEDNKSSSMDRLDGEEVGAATGGTLTIHKEDDLLCHSLYPGCLKEAEALLLVAWCCIVTEEYTHLLPLLEEITTGFDGRFPNELMLSKQIAFHVKTFLRDLINSETASSSLLEWVDELRDYKPSNGILTFQCNDQKLKAFVTPFNRWVSETLNEFRLSHTLQYSIADTYTVTAAFPRKKQLLDILSFNDIAIGGSDTVVATAALRHKQMALEGWGVHAISCKDLLAAHKDNRSHKLIASILSKIFPELLSLQSKYQQKDELQSNLKEVPNESIGAV